MIDKIIKFSVSGASAAAINLGLFFILEHFWNINYMFAVIMSTACSALYHFTLQKIWVFKSHSKQATKTESYLFIIASIVNLLLNEILLFVFVEKVHLHPLISQFLSLGLLACVNFFLYEYFIFRKSHRSANKLHEFLDKVQLKHILFAVGCIVWIVLHYCGVLYGTKNIPLHQSYVGDEQAPVNGALHILQDKSLFAVHNLTTLYYGPIFAVIALPAVAYDFGHKFITGQVSGAESYKTSILWDWGGIIAATRWIAVLAGLVGLIAVFFLSRTKAFNPNQNKTLPYLAALLLGLNFYYFEYSHFFKHWIFIISLFLIQLYIAARICDEDNKRKRAWLWAWNAIVIVISFGISYTSLFFELFWFGFLLTWYTHREFVYIKEWFFSMLSATLGMILVFLWHPYALLRIFRGGATKPFGEEMLGFEYFGRLLIENHIGLVIAFVCIAYVCIKRWKFVRSKYSSAWIWGLSLIALFQYVLFGAQPGLNREGRYMLPAIVCLTLLFAYVYALVRNEIKTKRILTIIILSCISFNVLFHLVHITKWMQIFARGPVEQQMIANLTSENTLLVQYYIAGHAHTKNAYKDYMDRFGRSEVNLFKELLETTPPAGSVPIDAYYIRPDQFQVDDIKGFERVIYLNEPRHEINQFDYFDESLVRLWWYDELSPSYHVIK